MANGSFNVEGKFSFSVFLPYVTFFPIALTSYFFLFVKSLHPPMGLPGCRDRGRVKRHSASGGKGGAAGYYNVQQSMAWVVEGDKQVENRHDASGWEGG